MMKNRAGNALLIATLFGVVMVISVIALVGLSTSYGQGHLAMNKKISVNYAAEAGLESVRWGAKNSLYGLNGNEYLYALSQITASGGPGTLTPCLSWTIDAPSQMRVEVFVERRSMAGNFEPFYRVSARGHVQSMNTELVMDVRERTSFAQYLFFINQGNINIGLTTTNGLVHSNGTITYTSPGAVATEFVSAVSGISGLANCNFVKGYDDNANAIQMPQITDIQALSTTADTQFTFGPGASVEIEFVGDRVIVKNNGTLVTAPSGDPLPSKQLIYVDGNVTSLKGDINGRCSVACTGAVDLTGPIRYIDQDGDPMYKLVDKTAGTTIGEQSTGAGVVWDGTRYDYIRNDKDDYGSTKYDPTNPSSLGIMAVGNVQVKRTTENYNMVFHCAIFSSNGMRYADLSQSSGNWRFVGANVTQLGGWRYSGSRGWYLSGTYTYDEYLIWNPPPHFMSQNVPKFGPVWRSN